MELLLIRHGRPRPEESATGAGVDPPLTEPGRAEADLLGRYLAADPGPDVVYTSPMRRARETAEAITARSVVPLTVDDRLREFDHGATSYTPPELSTAGPEARRTLWRALETGVWGAHTFDPDEFEARVAAAFADIIDAHASSVVAVVCHSGVINSFLGTVLRRPRGMFFQPAYTSISRVAASRDGRRQLLTLNETSHLQLAAVHEPRRS
ncbi:histidine phosphatase family protein, partial [Pseudonocardia sp. KRD-182]|jgi:broad specificity phosphatase PhoE|uniref:histidine phosphatase family protein n=1 Tax=Pseudonocardia oceani TaxID=2792013 RepID=UPI001C4A4147